MGIRNVLLKVRDAFLINLGVRVAPATKASGEINIYKKGNACPKCGGRPANTTYRDGMMQRHCQECHHSWVEYPFDYIKEKP